MSSRPTRWRSLGRLGLGLGLGLAAAPAAADERAECVDAHAEAQQLRKRGELRAARARLIVCAGGACPPLVVKDCAGWLAEVDAEQPTVILAARDESGRDVGDVSVAVDGRPLAAQLDGRPLEVDPGAHVLQARFAGGRTTSVQLLVRSGEKDRLVRLDLPRATVVAPSSAPAPASRDVPSERRLLPTSALVLASASVLALGSFVVFAGTGRNRESELAVTCRPNCAAGDISGVRRSYFIADLSLAVAAVSAAAAAWLTLSQAPQSPRPAR